MVRVDSIRGKIGRGNEGYKYKDDGRIMEKQKRDGDHDRTFEEV